MRKVVQTDKAPKAIGPYSQGIVCGNLLFVSGQIPLDPATGNQVRDSVEAQAARVLDNLKAVLEAGGSSIEKVCKVTIFLTSMDHFKTVNEVYARYFTKDQPARAAVAVAGLPLGFDVEMEAVALID
jgi:2-iminobutanoate/2-iminopropanoate deaminase